MQDKPQLKIDWASFEAAKYACENWHYSKCLPVGKLVKVGAWENDKYIGCVLFGRGANKHLGSPYGLGQDQCVELVRVALTKHKVQVSKVIAFAIKWLKKSNPNLRLIVSYADQTQNHHGGIYQAGNWIYTGIGAPATFFMIKGKLTHPKSLHSKKVSQNIQGARKLDKNAKAIEIAGKHRYLMPLDDEIKNKILILSKTYPKRVKEQESKNPFDLGGATPTHTLHSSFEK